MQQLTQILNIPVDERLGKKSLDDSTQIVKYS